MLSDLILRDVGKKVPAECEPAAKGVCAGVATGVAKCFFVLQVGHGAPTME